MWPIALFIGLMLWVVLFVILSVISHRRPGVGISNGELCACPNSPNCVSSESQDRRHAIDPIRIAGELDDAMARLLTVVRSIPRIKIVKANDAYIHAEAKSLIFRFVDDVEFMLDRSKRVIHCRSASRVGYGDFGINRRRMELIRAAFHLA